MRKLLHSPAGAIAVVVILATFAVGRCEARDLLPKWDMVTSVGIGSKKAGEFLNSSFLFSPDCIKATVVDPAEFPANPRPAPDNFSCGGDDPAFIGWPWAMQRTFFNDMLILRTGIWHQSQWFDGNGEIQATWPAAELTMNWSQLFRNRRGRR